MYTHDDFQIFMKMYTVCILSVRILFYTTSPVYFHLLFIDCSKKFKCLGEGDFFPTIRLLVTWEYYFQTIAHCYQPKKSSKINSIKAHVLRNIRYFSVYEALMYMSLNLTSLIKEPTCYKNPDNPSCIDLILTNKPFSFQNKNVQLRLDYPIFTG